MENVVRLLWVKIVGTAVLASVPLLFTPPWLMEALGFPRFESTIFLRLLGLSTTALLVGYYGGIEQARRGEWPSAVLRMGLVSNAGQGGLIVLAAASGALSGWGWPAQALLLSTGVFVLAIAAAIVALQRQRALSATSASPWRRAAT